MAIDASSKVNTCGTDSRRLDELPEAGWSIEFDWLIELDDRSKSDIFSVVEFVDGAWSNSIEMNCWLSGDSISGERSAMSGMSGGVSTCDNRGDRRFSGLKGGLEMSLPA